MQVSLLPDDGGRPIRLEKDVTVVGRRRWVCDIYVDDRTVSKFHCLVIRAPNGLLYVRDLGSANGTFVNGTRITEEAILHGDQVVFATRRYQLQIGEQTPVAEPEPVEADDNLRTLQIPDGQNPVEATPLPDSPPSEQPSAEGPLHTMKMGAEDGENLGQWLQVAASNDSADEGIGDIFDTTDASLEGGDPRMSDSDVKPV
jgi:pSer/pThr/pTyr-binding forkhead associated (FHA) protein